VGKERDCRKNAKKRGGEKGRNDIRQSKELKKGKGRFRKGANEEARAEKIEVDDRISSTPRDN